VKIPDRMLRIGEVADLLCMSTATIRRYLDDPDCPLKKVKIGTGKSAPVRVDPESVRTMLRFYGHNV